MALGPTGYLYEANRPVSHRAWGGVWCCSDVDAGGKTRALSKSHQGRQEATESFAHKEGGEVAGRQPTHEGQEGDGRGTVH